MTGRPARPGFPVNLIVAGRRCVVVGAGRVATGKIHGLLDAGADDVTVVAPEVGDDVRTMAERGRITLVVRPFTPTDLDGAWLAIGASGVPEVNAAVYAAGQERRVWVNCADDPAHCAVTLMSVARRADITVAIGTGGRSPALASWLREQIGDQIGPEYEVLVDLLSEAREELRAAGRSSADADWRKAFASGIVDLVREGRTGEAKELLRACL